MRYSISERDASSECYGPMDQSLYLHLLLKGDDILGFVSLRLIPLQLISHTLFGFVACHPFWPNGGSPSVGTLWPRSGELAKNKIAEGRVRSHNLPTGHTQFVQVTQLEI